MRRKLVVGNWKMNGSLAENEVLLSGLKAGCASFVHLPADVAVCVPAPYLAQCQEALRHCVVRWGGQDVSCHPGGAYTGEVSAAMLCDFGCEYVTVGHSERRAYHGESNELVGRKAAQAAKHGLSPIVCVGETLEQREAGQVKEVIGAQLDAALDALAETGYGKLVLAYEPVWAIGTGKTATPEIAQEVHAFMRARFAQRDADAAARVQILYGGSVKPENAKQLFGMPDIDGALVGGASLKAADFLGIVEGAA